MIRLIDTWYTQSHSKTWLNITTIAPVLAWNVTSCHLVSRNRLQQLLEAHVQILKHEWRVLFSCDTAKKLVGSLRHAVPAFPTQVIIPHQLGHMPVHSICEPGPPIRKLDHFAVALIPSIAAVTSEWLLKKLQKVNEQLEFLHSICSSGCKSFAAVGSTSLDRSCTCPDSLDVVACCFWSLSISGFRNIIWQRHSNHEWCDFLFGVIYPFLICFTDWASKGSTWCLWFDLATLGLLIICSWLHWLDQAGNLAPLALRRVFSARMRTRCFVAGIWLRFCLWFRGRQGLTARFQRWKSSQHGGVTGIGICFIITSWRRRNATGWSTWSGGTWRRKDSCRHWWCLWLCINLRWIEAIPDSI